MARHRAQLKMLAHEKHSGTKVFTIGPGTVATAFHIMRDTQVGDRDPAGGNDTIQLGRSFEQECNIGDKCKYINIHIEAGPRAITSVINVGWLEWAFVCHKGTDAEPTNVNLATNTLGDVCTKYFRNECIYTGIMGIGVNFASVQEVTLKIPKNKISMRVGDEWTLYLHTRTVSATETGTNTFRVLTSYNYINYH